MNLFYLPPGITVEKAQGLWRELDSKGNGGAVLSYIDEDHQDIKTTDRSLREVLANVQHSTTIVLWSVKQINMGMKDFSALVLKQRNRSVTIRILNPDFSLDPDVPECYSVISLMEAVQGKSSDGKRTDSGFGYKKLDESTIQGLKQGKKDGKSLKQLSRDFNVSVTTICKYTKGIKPILREKKVEVSKH